MAPGSRESVWRTRKKACCCSSPPCKSATGGLRFGTDSSDYAAILNWIKRGAGYGAKTGGGHIERIQVFPSEVVLD